MAERFAAVSAAQEPILFCRATHANRIGENIIVFDFIRLDVATLIIDQMVRAVLDDVAALGFGIALKDQAMRAQRGICLSV